MYRGTTPTLKVNIKGLELEQAKEVWLTIRQGNVKLTKTLPDIEVDGGTATVRLSQKETLMFSPGTADVQLRVLLEDDVAAASNIKQVTFEKILRDGVIKGPAVNPDEPEDPVDPDNPDGPVEGGEGNDDGTTT